MNQVTEMLQLGPDASESEAIARLSKLFATMAGAKRLPQRGAPA